MIPEEWLKNQGKGSIVGIIDTGLERSLNCFDGVEIEYKEFSVKNKRHGTHVASTIVSFSPKLKLIFAGGSLDNYENLEEMLSWISNFKIDVLNLSLSFQEDNKAIRSLLERMNNQGTIIVSAFSSLMHYPCRYPFVLKAGSGGDFEAPEEWSAFFPTGKKGLMKGSSVSCAITSGLCSLGKAIIPSMNKENFLSQVVPQDVFLKNQPKKQVNVKL